jgi:hypothetical protein
LNVPVTFEKVSTRLDPVGKFATGGFVPSQTEDVLAIRQRSDVPGICSVVEKCVRGSSGWIPQKLTGARCFDDNLDDDLIACFTIFSRSDWNRIGGSGVSRLPPPI